MTMSITIVLVLLLVLDLVLLLVSVLVFLVIISIIFTVSITITLRVGLGHRLTWITYDSFLPRTIRDMRISTNQLKHQYNQFVRLKFFTNRDTKQWATMLL